MKILYVTDSYPPIINGVSYVVEHLARHMAVKGHEVEVVTLDSSWCLPRVEEMDEVLVRRLPGFSPGRSYHFPSPEIFQSLKRKAGVMHVHNFHSVLPLICSMRFSDNGHDEQFVVTPHYHTPGHHLHSKVAWFLYKPLLQSSIRRYDAVHCVSCFEAERVARDFGVSPIVVENGVDEDVYDYKWVGIEGDTTTFNLTFVGRLERYKRVDWVVRAASIIMKKGYKVKVNIVGSGPEAPSLINLARELGVQLNLFQHIPRNVYLKLLSESSCVVNPSLYEAFSITCAEALAMGVPVVVVRPWGINFDGYPRAIIVDPDVSSVADGILDIRGMNGKPVVNPPSWKDVADAIYRGVYCR